MVDWTGDKKVETSLWRGDTGDARYLGSRLRAARQRVQDGRWRPSGWKLVRPGGPRPEQGWKIGCERAMQLSLRVVDGRGGQYKKCEVDGSRKQSNGGTGF